MYIIVAVPGLNVHCCMCCSTCLVGQSRSDPILRAAVNAITHTRMRMHHVVMMGAARSCGIKAMQ